MMSSVSGQKPTDDEAPRIDITRPHAARMYDYLIEGKDNFAADRSAVDELLTHLPDARDAARENRFFLRRAVQHLATKAGIRQFIDIGTGLPAPGSVYEVASEVNGDCRVVYIDNDAVVAAHARALLATNSLSTAFV